jgi:hypothetical protein
MSEDNGLEAENDLTESQMEELSGPIGKPGQMPRGNPAHVSAGEADLRKQEIAQLGQEEAARRAWERAKAKRSKSPPGKTAPPRKATTFADIGAAQAPKAPKDKPRDIKGIASTVQFAHAMLAMKMQNQDFAISEDEAYMLTKAVDDLLVYYGVKMSGKASAWSALIYAVTMIYGPRVASLIMARNKEKAA